MFLRLVKESTVDVRYRDVFTRSFFVVNVTSETWFHGNQNHQQQQPDASCGQVPLLPHPSDDQRVAAECRSVNWEIDGGFTSVNEIRAQTTQHRYLDKMHNG